MKSFLSPKTGRGESGRSWVKVDGPTGWKWTVQTPKSGRSWVKVDGPNGQKVDGLRKWTVQRIESGRSEESKVDGPKWLKVDGPKWLKVDGPKWLNDLKYIFIDIYKELQIIQWMTITNKFFYFLLTHETLILTQMMSSLPQTCV